MFYTANVGIFTSKGALKWGFVWVVVWDQFIKRVVLQCKSDLLLIKVGNMKWSFLINFSLKCYKQKMAGVKMLPAVAGVLSIWCIFQPINVV